MRQDSRLLIARATAAVLVFGAALGGAGCPAAGRRVAPFSIAATWSHAEPAPARTVGGLAIAGDAVVVTAGASVQRLDGGRRVWARDLAANVVAGPVAVHGGLVALAVSGQGALDGLPHGLRGEPGAALVALDAATGEPRWQLSIGATAWAIVRTVVADRAGFLVAGVFAGTLRAGDRVVTSAGSTDGFWARIGDDGKVTSLQRMGGEGADAIAGVAVLADGGLGIAGTFTGPAALLAQELDALYNGPHADGFVARLAADGRVAWSRTWGGPVDDACAGLVATTDGVAVAATVRGAVDVAGHRLEVRGPSDGLLAWFDSEGAVRAATLVGGDDLDGLVGLAGKGDRVVAIGWYAGSLDAPGGRLTATGGDDPMIAAATPDGLAAVFALDAPGTAAMHAIAADGGAWVFAAGTDAPAQLAGEPLAAGTAVRVSRW